MQLERGKATLGFVGTFKSIIAQEGCVCNQCSSYPEANLANAEPGGYTEVPSQPDSACYAGNIYRIFTGLVPPLLLEAPKRAVKLYV